MGYKQYTQQENEFFSENEIVQIIPNFKEDIFEFISGRFGPFRPSKPASVPLWFAIYLKKRNKCTIQMPRWLDYTYLTKVKIEEKQTETHLSQDLPYYYYEIASLLFTQCPEEFNVNGHNVQKVKSVIEDIYEIRKGKMQQIMKDVSMETPAKYVGFCGSVEIN